MTLDQVVGLAGAQASAYQQARFNESIAAEDVRQARAAFLPRFTAPLSYIYTSPLIGPPPGTPRGPSFIANNGIGEYQAFASMAGDVDTAGRLRATLERSRALLEAAHAGTEVARRALVESTVEAYYGLVLATARRQAAEQSLGAAQEFERITAMLFSGGEVAQVDVTRARLQTIQRRDDLEKARADEAVASGGVRVLIGYDFQRPLTTINLATALPVASEIDRYTDQMVSTRPEFAQFEAQRRAAEQDIRIARADRRPALSYTVNGGFDTDSVKLNRLKQHTGVAATINLTIPIFDWGASKSRERQARLRLQLTESTNALARRGFIQQFYAARAQALSAAVRIREAGAGVRDAENNLSASIARYRAGEAQIIEVTDAQTTLATQRTALYQAIFDYQTALARLRQATGQ